MGKPPIELPSDPQGTDLWMNNFVFLSCPSWVLLEAQSYLDRIWFVCFVSLLQKKKEDSKESEVNAVRGGMPITNTSSKKDRK